MFFVSVTFPTTRFKSFSFTQVFAKLNLLPNSIFPTENAHPFGLLLLLFVAVVYQNWMLSYDGLGTEVNFGLS